MLSRPWQPLNTHLELKKTITCTYNSSGALKPWYDKGSFFVFFYIMRWHWKQIYPHRKCSYSQKGES
jgi:hypothetical protein